MANMNFALINILYPLIEIAGYWCDCYLHTGLQESYSFLCYSFHCFPQGTSMYCINYIQLTQFACVLMINQPLNTFTQGLIYEDVILLTVLR